MNFNIAEFECSYGTSIQLPSSTIQEIVFSGRSNVGKSSLINKILNRKSLAKVSATPGKTATINFFRLREVRFVDLPGYGYAKVSQAEKKRWAELVEGYFNQNRNISLIIQIIDIRHLPSVNDIDMINYLYNKKLPFIIALTKLDKLNKTQRIERLTSIASELSAYDNIKSYPCSSINGDGIDEIRKLIETYVEKHNS